MQNFYWKTYCNQCNAHELHSLALRQKYTELKIYRFLLRQMVHNMCKRKTWRRKAQDDAMWSSYWLLVRGCAKLCFEWIRLDEVSSLHPTRDPLGHFLAAFCPGIYSNSSEINYCVNWEKLQLHLKIISQYFCWLALYWTITITDGKALDVLNV